MEDSTMGWRAMRFASGLLVLTSAIIAGGCASRSHVFEGRDVEPVWTAMKTVAAQPQYDDWSIPTDGNHVWVNDEQRRIEIYRKLERFKHEPGKSPDVDERTWRIQVYLSKLDPPTAKFVSRDLVIPAWAWEEADRYFADVEALLGPRPEPPVEELIDDAVDVAPADADDNNAKAPFELIEVESPR
jgi:hypothetical protein